MDHTDNYLGLDEANTDVTCLSLNLDSPGPSLGHGCKSEDNDLDARDHEHCILARSEEYSKRTGISVPSSRERSINYLRNKFSWLGQDNEDRIEKKIESRKDSPRFQHFYGVSCAKETNTENNMQVGFCKADMLKTEFQEKIENTNFVGDSFVSDKSQEMLTFGLRHPKSGFLSASSQPQSSLSSRGRMAKLDSTMVSTNDALMETDIELAKMLSLEGCVQGQQCFLPPLNVDTVQVDMGLQGAMENNQFCYFVSEALIERQQSCSDKSYMKDELCIYRDHIFKQMDYLDGDCPHINKRMHSKVDDNYKAIGYWGETDHSNKILQATSFANEDNKVFMNSRFHEISELPDDRKLSCIENDESSELSFLIDDEFEMNLSMPQFETSAGLTNQAHPTRFANICTSTETSVSYVSDQYTSGQDHCVHSTNWNVLDRSIQNAVGYLEGGTFSSGYSSIDTSCLVGQDQQTMQRLSSQKRFSAHKHYFANSGDILTDNNPRGSSVAQFSMCFDERQVPTSNKVSTEQARRLSEIRSKGKPREFGKHRPRDRQLIQDRLSELRGIIPNTSKCSIDSLLERTIKHMMFLQCVTKQAEALRDKTEQKEDFSAAEDVDLSDYGASWALEVNDHSLTCPIKVEKLSSPQQMLVKMICVKPGQFLEATNIIESLGLKIIKGTVEAQNEKIWMQFIVEVVTDNAASFVAAGRILMASYPTIYWTPCAAHCLDLLLEDIGKINWISMAKNSIERMEILLALLPVLEPRTDASSVPTLHKVFVG